MRNIILFFNKLCIMFTVTTITYGIFNSFTQINQLFYPAFFQCVGLAILFSIALTILDYLSNKIKILASNSFIWIQYIILISIIISWAVFFKWGDWNNEFYVVIFIVAFTLIYLFIYFFIDLSNKKSDSKINEQLRKYQENISKE